MKKRKILFIIIVLTSVLPSVGHSSWHLVASKDVQYSYNKIAPPVVAVAYIKYSDSNKLYTTTIERALKLAAEDPAANTIYVVPGTNPTITRNTLIADGDTLIIPYEDNGNDVPTFLNRNDTTSNATFGDLNSDNVNKNRKNQVTIRENISLINNGTLTVGGSIGYGGSATGITGQTASSYCEILMNNNSKIINNGNINLYGYIKESSKNNGSYVEHGESSVIKLPFVVYDFRGGSYSLACYNKNVVPFSNYDFPNCQSLQKFYYGSKMYGLATIYAGGSWSTPEVLVLGTDSDSCLFKLSNNYATDNYATIKYTPSNVLYTTNDVNASTTTETANLTEIHTFADISLSNLRIELNVGLTIMVDTSVMDCPLCFKYQVIVERGTLTISNKMKFLGGASLLIKPGATVACNANVSFYQEYIPNIITGGSNLYPSSFTTANLVNNGILNLNSAFGGLVATSETTGILNTNNGFSDSVKTTEILSSKGSSIFASADKTEDKVQNALAYVGTAEKPNEPVLLTKPKSFESKGDYWHVTLTDITSVTISPNSAASGKNKLGTFNLSALVSPTENASSNVTYNWTCDSGATLSSNSGQTVTLTTPANSTDIDKSYEVTCIVNFTKSDGTQASVTATGSFTATAKASESWCIAFNTLVTMEDGSTKQAGLLRAGDMIKVFNHETGTIDVAPVLFNDDIDKMAEEYTVVYLQFNNGKQIKIVDEHGFFDINTMKYEYINEFNYSTFVGHKFASITNDRLGVSILESAYIKRETLRICSPVSYFHLNLITEEILSIPGGISGLFNIFDYGENLQYDERRKNSDIEQFGLFTYEDFENKIPLEFYKAFPTPYLKVSIGKGMITMEDIDYLIDRYLPIASEQQGQ